MSKPRPGFPARLPVGAPASKAQESAPGAAPGSVAGAVSGTPASGAVPVRHGRVLTAPSPPLSVREGEGMSGLGARVRMTQRLGAQGIQSPAVLQAMQTVPRHHFVDAALVAQAYEDTSLPIGLGQTISRPSVVARMLDLMVSAPNWATELSAGRVLEVGTGCGYQAALLSVLVREVYSIERLRVLHDKARHNLRPLRLANVHLLLGDGSQGFPKGAPYSAIVVAASAAQVYSAWCDQLAVGGRLIAPVQTQSDQQSLVVIDRTAQGWKEMVLEGVHFVPLKSGVV